MDISETVLLAVLIPVDVLLLAIVIYGIVYFRKSILELEKFTNNQINKNYEKRNF